MDFHDYSVRVWGSGDVSIFLRNELEYATLGNADGMQCNFDHGTKEYAEIKRAARKAARAMRGLDEAIGK